MTKVINLGLNKVGKWVSGKVSGNFFGGLFQIYLLLNLNVNTNANKFCSNCDTIQNTSLKPENVESNVFISIIK